MKRELSIHLMILNTYDKIPEMIDTFEELRDSILDMEADFSFEFVENIHNRNISQDKGRIISPGRGLDILQCTGDILILLSIIQRRESSRHLACIY